MQIIEACFFFVCDAVSTILNMDRAEQKKSLTSRHIVSFEELNKVKQNLFNANHNSTAAKKRNHLFSVAD